MRIGILGGGIAGLACAHYLTKTGHQPVVIEPSGQVGGPDVYFDHAGSSIDCFPNTIRDKDSALCGLMADIGVLGRVAWAETRSGILINRENHRVNSGRDLMRVESFSLRDRLHCTLGMVYLTRYRRYALDLDKIPASTWLPQIFGTHIYNRIWRPFLEVRFGEYADEVPAYWIWRKLNHHMSGRRECRGAIRGGQRWLIDQLRKAVEERGGAIRVNTEITGVEANGNCVKVELNGHEQIFDAVVSTLPIPDLVKLSRGALTHEVPLTDVAYQGLISAAVVSKRPLGEFYSTAVFDEQASFNTVFDSSHVVPSEWIGDRNVLHLNKYCGAHTESYQLSDDVVAKQAIETLHSINPEFSPEDVEAVRVFRTPHADPIWSCGQLKRGPEFQIGDSRVFLCTSAQSYPRLPGWDTDVALAREAIAKLQMVVPNGNVSS